MKKSWIMIIHIEVQRHYPVCFGTWETGTASTIANVLFQNILEKFRPHIRFDLDAEHNPIGERPLYNNFFVTAVRNLAAHLFLNCEAGSQYENRERLEESGWTTCFNDFTDLMYAARLGTDGYVKLQGIARAMMIRNPGLYPGPF